MVEKDFDTTDEPRPYAIAASLELLPAEALDRPFARRLDAMLERLSAYDFLAAIVLAESLLLEAPEHGLAGVCRAEALAMLRSFFEGPLAVVRTDTAGLTEDAFALLAGAEGCTPTALLPPDGIEHVRGMRALHDLVRLGYFETRENTFAERINAPPSLPPLPRIEERANAAATEELERALALHPGARFGIGRCEELDFGTLWDHPASEGCTEIFPLAIGAAPDMARREKNLIAWAREQLPERVVNLAGGPAFGTGATHVIYVVIAPPVPAG